MADFGAMNNKKFKCIQTFHVAALLEMYNIFASGNGDVIGMKTMIAQSSIMFCA